MVADAGDRPGTGPDAGDGSMGACVAGGRGPQILEVRGSLAAGELVTISGCAFGAKRQAAPVRFDLFEEGPAGGQLHTSEPSWRPYDRVRGAMFSGSSAHSGAQAVMVHVEDGESFHSNYYSLTTSSTEIYLSYWWRTANIACPTGGCGTVVKMSRITSSEASGGGGVYNGAGGTTLGGTFNIYAENGPYCAFDNGGDCGEEFHGGCEVARLEFPPMNTWFRVEMYKRLSTPGLTDGAVFVRMFGVDAAANPEAMTRAAGETFELDTVLLGTMDGSPANHSYDILIDDVYIDTTQARVEICDTSTWSARAHCEIQSASTWAADGRNIDVTLMRGSFAEGTMAYVYVVDSSGNANEMGYPITFAR